MYEDDYEPLLNGTEYGLETDDAERLKQALTAERSAELELQMEQDEQILFLHAVRAYSSKKIREIRGSPTEISARYATPCSRRFIKSCFPY